MYFSLRLADGEQFELAQLYGHDLKALVVATNGLPDYLLLDVELSLAGGESYLTASCSAEAILTNLTTVGEHRVGLAPALEIA